MRTAYRCQASATPEEAIQKAIFEHYKIRGREGAVMFHVPNGGHRSKRTAANLKAQGVQAGAPDIVCCIDGRFYGPETKSEAGNVTKTQREFGLRLQNAGGEYHVAPGLDQALDYLEEWGVLEPR